jgi:hypothetical protein
VKELYELKILCSQKKLASFFVARSFLENYDSLVKNTEIDWTQGFVYLTPFIDPVSLEVKKQKVPIVLKITTLEFIYGNIL